MLHGPVNSSFSGQIHTERCTSGENRNEANKPISNQLLKLKGIGWTFKITQCNHMNCQRVQ